MSNCPYSLEWLTTCHTCKGGTYIAWNYGNAHDKHWEVKCNYIPWNTAIFFPEYMLSLLTRSPRGNTSLTRYKGAWWVLLQSHRRIVLFFHPSTSAMVHSNTFLFSILLFFWTSLTSSIFLLSLLSRVWKFNYLYYFIITRHTNSFNFIVIHILLVPQ